MARFRARRWLLWGLLFLPVLAVPAAFILGRAYVNQRLQSDFSLGRYRLHLVAPRLGWDLRFTADSLVFSSPSAMVRAGRLRCEARFWQSLVSLNPSFLATADSIRVELAGKPERRQPRVLALRPGKPAVFPTLRIPVPFRLEAEAVTVGRSGRALVRVADAALYSQGPKGAAVEWKRALFAPDDSAYALEGAFRASARWFGKRLRYQASFQGASGDAFRLEGERRKADLRRGRDSLEASASGLEAYARWFGGDRVPPATELKATASVDLDDGPALRLQTEFTYPVPMRIGPQRISLRLGFRDSVGTLRVDSRGEQGQTALVQGSFHLPLADSLPIAALPSLIRGEFTGHTRNVRVPIGRWVLPGDAEIRRFSIAGGEAQAEVRTRDSSEVSLRFFRDSLPRLPWLEPGIPPHAGRGPKAETRRTAGAGTGARAGAAGGPSWRFTLSGRASPTETWARIWTRNQVNYRSALLVGEFRPGELIVDVRGQGVTAYMAAADSLWARNVIRRRGYYLSDSRLYWQDEVWPIKGRVEWGERKASRSPRGLRLRREVSLAFGSDHARHGSFEFAMPRRGAMVVTAGRLATEHLFVPRLDKVRPYRPVLDGRFAWDWEWRTGDAGLRSDILYRGRRMGLDLEAAWDARNLRIPRLEAAVDGSRLRVGAALRLRGEQFYHLRGLGLDDVASLSLEADRFDAAHLAALVPGGALASGSLDGSLAYADTSGFRGTWTVREARLRPPADVLEIPFLSATGRGRDMVLVARTASQKHPFLNDTLRLTIDDVLGRNPGVSLRAVSAGGFTLGFDGGLPGLKALRGRFTAAGGTALPGGAGSVDSLRVRGRLDAPLERGFVKRLRVDSAVLEGRYLVRGLDTQTFRGELEVRDGRVLVPSLTAEDGGGRALAGEAEVRLGKPLRASAKLRGQSVILQVQGLQKLVLQDVEASLRADSAGTSATARAARTSFQAARGALAAKGELENLSVAYVLSPAAAGKAETPRLAVKGRLRGFELKHKIGFRDMQRFFRTVKVEKRRKRIKPVDLDIDIEAVGAENRVETDILRMYFTGGLSMRGVYPYTMLNGEVSALSGQIGQTGQSYDIDDFGLRWQNATMEEGVVNVEGSKRLKADCRPETQRTCNVFIRLEGRLEEMSFTYDSDCGQTGGGEVIEPAALITSVSRGCYSGEYVSGAGDGGGYGEAMFTFLEPAISANLSRRVSKASAGWIQSTQVTGIGAVVAGDTTVDAEPISVSLETKEWKGLKGKAKAGYHPESKLPSPWENGVSVEWRVPLEKVAADSGWKRRVRNRITLEASAETRPEERLSGEEEQDVEVKAGLRYRFRFWRLW
jgi:hypothetical protein